MYISGQNFTSSVLDRIRQTVSNEPSISRLDLSRRVCGWLNWVSPGGSPQEMSCRKALNKLDAAAVIDLPKQSVDYSFGYKSTASIALDIPDIQGALKDLGEVKVYPVSSRYAKESKIWFAFFERCHYLGNGNLCGAQIRYLVKSSAGYLGALAFSAASWSLKDRDNHIGWQEGARRAHLRQLICNSRFLILPTVKVSNLASRMLSLALARVADDWEKRYCIRVLVETFVASPFTGACCKAANFTYVGKSAGRRDGTQKNIFLYPLCRKWRDILCEEPAVAMPRPETLDTGQRRSLEQFVCTMNVSKKGFTRLLRTSIAAPKPRSPRLALRRCGRSPPIDFFRTPG